MVKAKEFLEFICKDLNYRLFSGVPCLGLAPIYKHMNKDFMHYIPAANERIAVGISMGASLSGLGSVVLLEDELWSHVCGEFEQVKKFFLPVLFIIFSNKPINKKVLSLSENYKTDLADLSTKLPNLLFIESGVLK